jgi:hypothetical protein
LLYGTDFELIIGCWFSLFCSMWIYKLTYSRAVVSLLYLSLLSISCYSKGLPATKRPMLKPKKGTKQNMNKTKIHVSLELFLLSSLIANYFTINQVKSFTSLICFCFKTLFFWTLRAQCGVRSSTDERTRIEKKSLKKKWIFMESLFM